MSEAFVAIIVVSVGVLLFLAGLLAVVFVRSLNVRNAPPPHSGTDLANMTILFHTMRDVVSQQKQLAADFNKSLDRRVTEINKVVELIRKERELLRESRTQLNELLKRAREVEATIQGRSASPAAAPQAVSPPPRPVAPEPEEIAVPEDDLIENWTGLDFGSDDDAELDRDDEPDAEPVPREDAEAARDAFRSLLNLETPTADVKSSGANAGNGRDHMNSLEQLVYEYSDAGMSVPAIAREIGVGKGEVRLIQSLRKKKGH